MTSQFLAIFYLAKLQHFIRHNLHLKFINYIDDYIIIHQDKECLKKYHNQHLPTFMMFVCLSDNLSGSEILILNYEEIEPVINKSSIIIGIEKNKNYALLYIEKSKANALHIPRNRIEIPFDEIVENVISLNPYHYCPVCGTKVHP